MTFVGGSVYDGGNRRLGPPILTPPFITAPPLIIVSKCLGPYANRISGVFRVDFVHKFMFLRSATKPPMLRVLTKNDISKNCRIDFVNKSMLLRSTTKPPICSIRGRFGQTSFFMRGVTVLPSKLIVTNNVLPQEDCFY